MSELSHLLMPRAYPHALGEIVESFEEQPNGYTCGPAALRHGLLLGGLSAPVDLLASLLETHKNGLTDSPEMLKALRGLGFDAEPKVKKPKKKPTADFLNELRPELEQGAFLLPCVQQWMHWVCLGWWDGERAWVVDSATGTWAPPWYALCLGFFPYTAEQFNYEEWWDWLIVVRPGKWADQYKAWLPARHVLLRMAEKDGLAQPATVDAAVQVAAHQYLNDVKYSYSELDLYFSGGVEVAVRVQDPGKDAVLVDKHGEGEDQVLVVRRVADWRGRTRRGRGLSTLTRQTPPELVLRAGQLRAAQLG